MPTTATDGGTASPAPTGRFTFSPLTERWQWSDAMYALHGLEPGDVVPTAGLFARHVHPDDRSLVEAVLQLGRSREAGCEYRLVDMAGAERAATLAVSPAPDGSVTGLVVDVTRTRSRAVAEAVDGHLALALESRTVIDQAKGVVMSTFGTDSETAFASLVSISQRENIRVRAIAELIRTAAEHGGLDPALRAVVRSGLDAVSERAATSRRDVPMRSQVG
ncbi:PAS and ANTAR domain-containing protein [Cellulomonas sp. URHD0024]|uniref:ANTAR domain-containing protein n=1 Tax=Cellulomonas sp. URHD0024 TaxID=1302620 RepID=UPI000685F0A6|nr:PAS and ANTAR domain-containing protein [Cellulomonas sp. URHD0024]